MRVEVKPALLRWARDRAGLDPEEFAHRFPRFGEWERESLRPTLKQLEQFANATHTPIGFLFLPEPPAERVPIPDFRTTGSRRVERPSPDLLDTVYLCQQRQEWYRDFVRSQAEKPIDLVGSVNINSNVEGTAAAMRRTLGFDLEERRQMPTWTHALRRFIEQADAIGVLVMVNGVVGNNNYRKLDPDEFRGFALADALAPLVFINGADTKAAQMFTLAHELAHIWLGESALSDVGPVTVPANQVERWCNQVAAELLVPLAILRTDYEPGEALRSALDRLARRFKVSTLVILRRIHDAGGLTQDQLWAAYQQELARLREIPRGSGGDFYLTQAARVGKRFARALVASTLEGQTLHREKLRFVRSMNLPVINSSDFHIGASLYPIIKTGA
jgi:Zn-dependent peptidase ImmA (M78 family)